MSYSLTEEQLKLVPEHIPHELIRSAETHGMRGRPPSGVCPFQALSDLHAGPRILYSAPVPGDFSQPGAWLLTRAEDIRLVLQKPEVFSSHGIAGFSRLVGENWDLIPLELDAPQHAKFRAIMNSIFSPARVAAMEEGVRARAVSLIDAVSANHECEFVADFGRPFPVSIFMQLMGLPDEDMESLNHWEHQLLHSSTIDERIAGGLGFLHYLRDLIALRRADPADDLTSFAVLAQVDGRPLTDDEVMGICYLLVVAGLDTVAASLGLHFRHLAQNPEDQQKLREDPSLIPLAVEEFLRRYSIVTTSRFVTHDTEVAGVKMKKGDRVTCSTALASLDPSEFENPLHADITRSPNRHVAFSYGPHRCIGSHLARREMIIAIEEWLKRIPPFRIKGARDIPVSPGALLNIQELPLEW